MGASCWQGDQEGRKGGKKGESEKRRREGIRGRGRDCAGNYFLTFLGGQLAACNQAEQDGNREEESHPAPARFSPPPQPPSPILQKLPSLNLKPSHDPQFHFSPLLLFTILHPPPHFFTLPQNSGFHEQFQRQPASVLLSHLAVRPRCLK